MSKEKLSKFETGYLIFWYSLLGLLVLSICFLIIRDFFCNGVNLSFDAQELLNFDGLFFTVTGVVIGFFFVVLGFYSHETISRLNKAKDNLDSLENTILKINSADSIKRTHYKILDNFFEQQIKIASDNNEEQNKLRLCRTRLACISDALNMEVRKRFIGEFGSINRHYPAMDEIEDDIKLLESLKNDKNEIDDIRDKAEESLTQLKKRKEKEKYCNNCIKLYAKRKKMNESLAINSFNGYEITDTSSPEKKNMFDILMVNYDNGENLKTRNDDYVFGFINDRLTESSGQKL